VNQKHKIKWDHSLKTSGITNLSKIKTSSKPEVMEKETRKTLSSKTLFQLPSFYFFSF